MCLLKIKSKARYYVVNVPNSMINVTNGFIPMPLVNST